MMEQAGVNLRNWVVHIRRRELWINRLGRGFVTRTGRLVSFDAKLNFMFALPPGFSEFLRASNGNNAQATFPDINLSPSVSTQVHFASGCRYAASFL